MLGTAAGAGFLADDTPEAPDVDDTPEARDAICAGPCRFQEFNTTVFTVGNGGSDEQEQDWYTCCLMRAGGLINGSVTVTIDDIPAAHPAQWLARITFVSGDLTVIGNHRKGYTIAWPNLTEIGGRLLLFNVTSELSFPQLRTIGGLLFADRRNVIDPVLIVPFNLSDAAGLSVTLLNHAGAQMVSLPSLQNITTSEASRLFIAPPEGVPWSAVIRDNLSLSTGLAVPTVAVDLRGNTTSLTELELLALKDGFIDVLRSVHLQGNFSTPNNLWWQNGVVRLTPGDPTFRLEVAHWPEAGPSLNAAVAAAQALVSSINAGSTGTNQEWVIPRGGGTLYLVINSSVEILSPAPTLGPSLGSAAIPGASATSPPRGGLVKTQRPGSLGCTAAAAGQDSTSRVMGIIIAVAVLALVAVGVGLRTARRRERHEVSVNASGFPRSKLARTNNSAGGDAAAAPSAIVTFPRVSNPYSNRLLQPSHTSAIQSQTPMITLVPVTVANAVDAGDVSASAVAGGLTQQTAFDSFEAPSQPLIGLGVYDGLPDLKELGDSTTPQLPTFGLGTFLPAPPLPQPHQPQPHLAHPHLAHQVPQPQPHLAHGVLPAQAQPIAAYGEVLQVDAALLNILQTFNFAACTSDISTYDSSATTAGDSPLHANWSPGSSLDYQPKEPTGTFDDLVYGRALVQSEKGGGPQQAAAAQIPEVQLQMPKTKPNMKVRAKRATKTTETRARTVATKGRFDRWDPVVWKTTINASIRGIFARIEVNDAAAAAWVHKRIVAGAKAEPQHTAHPCFRVLRKNPDAKSPFQIQIGDRRLVAQKCIYAVYHCVDAGDVGTWQVAQQCLHNDSTWWCFEPTHLEKCTKDHVSAGIKRHKISGNPDAYFVAKMRRARRPKGSLPIDAKASKAAPTTVLPES